MDCSQFDDPVFPRTRQGQRAAGMVLESSGGTSTNVKGKEDKGKTDGGVFESYSDTQSRIQAMGAVLSWVSGDEYTYVALDGYVAGLIGLDDDFEQSDDDDAYNAVWKSVPDALLTLGASDDDVEKLVNGEDDDAAARVGKALSNEMESIEADDDDLIGAFAFGEEAVLESASGDESLTMILEATYKKRKVVRDGKVVTVRKRVSGAKLLSPAQKASVKKMQRKSQTGAAKLAWRKSMKIRAKRGM